MNQRLRHDGSTDLIVRRLGIAIAAISALTLIVSLFLPWGRQSRNYVVFGGSGSPPLPASGWQLLSPEDLIICAAGLAGIAVLGLWPRPAGRARWLAAAAAAVGLVSSLVTAPHAVASVLGPAAPMIALSASLLLSGGAMLTAVGDRFFEPVVRGWISAVIVLAPAVFVATMFLPWLRVGSASRSRGEPFTPSPITYLAAWDLPLMPLLLVLCAAAVAGGAGVAATLGWRAAYLACALGGWLTSAVAFVGVGLAAAGLHAHTSWGVYPAAATGVALIGACLVASIRQAPPATTNRPDRPSGKAPVPSSVEVEAGQLVSGPAVRLTS